MLQLCSDLLPFARSAFVRGVLPQSIVNPILVVVFEVLTNQSSQVGFVDHDHVVQ
jgi:hypothetical protein